MAGDLPDRNQMVARARAATGLEDMGPDTWQEGLDRLLDDLEANARLNEIGCLAVQQDTEQYLANRLAVLDWRRRHPAVADEIVERPLVIVGQPRTGTTILVDLLAQDPRFRAPQSWEVDHPVPPPVAATYTTDERIAATQATLDLADEVVPGFTAFHPMGATLVQECVRITAGDFRSMIFPVQYHVPAYNRWLLHDADLAPAYRWHRRVLEHFQSGLAGEQWLLKSPGHLWHLGALMAEYPDAVVVQTHRDPLRVIASISALAAHLRRMVCDDPSIGEAAGQYVDDVVVGLERTMAARDDGTVPADQAIDVHFTDTVADPMGVVATIYRRQGIELSAEAERRMRRFLVDHPGDGGGGGRRYTFADTGLDEGELRARVEPYQERFGVASEPVL